MQYHRAIAITLLLTLTSLGVAGGATESPTTYTPQSVPRLQNFGTLVGILNLARGAVRVVVILNPSAAGCQDALTAVNSMLQSNASKRLRVYVVWSRLGKEDTELRAISMSTGMRDRRLVYFWDPEAFVANSFRGVVGSGDSPATGVLLLYDTDTHLALDPPAPSMWMSVNPALTGPALDPAELGSQANEMVRRVEAKVNDAAPSGQ